MSLYIYASRFRGKMVGSVKHRDWPLILLGLIKVKLKNIS